MDRYAAFIRELTQLGVREDSEPIPPDEVGELRTHFPGIPEDYLEFLEQVGWGALGDGWLMVYGEPLTPDNVFDDESARDVGPVWLVADNFGGVHYAFVPENDWELVRIDSADLLHRPVEDTFEGAMWARLRIETA